MKPNGIITGGASGIGLATAIRLAPDFKEILLIDKSWESHSDLPNNCKALALDVANKHEIESFFEDHKQGFDVLVNCAGINMVGDIPKLSSSDWEACFDINLKAVFLFCHHVIPRMAKKGGSIINISSSAGILPRTSDPIYGTSKAALISLTERIALCHADRGIRANAIAPGPVANTGIMKANFDKGADENTLIEAMPLGPWAKRMTLPEDIAETIAFLISEPASLITGAVIPIDGGKALGVPKHLNQTGIA